MPRKQKKYHYIYKTTCLITGKFYVGMHSTDSLEDGYLGSGKILGYSRKKYGDDNHHKQIIEFLPSREALKLREKELVNEMLLADPLNMNLKYGGEGGGTSEIAAKGWKNPNRKSRQSLSMRANWENNPERRHEYAISNSLKLKLQHASGKMQYGNWLGLRHSDATKAKIGAANAVAQLGAKNSQFGTCWVTRDSKPIKIKKEQLDEYLANGYSRGRK